MKKSLLFFVCCLGFSFCRAQTGSYSILSIPYYPNSYSAGTQIPRVDDIWSAKIPIGFDFTYFNKTYYQIIIGTNGILSFDSTVAGTYCAWDLSNGLNYNGIIMLPYQDLDVNGGGWIRYTTDGVSPNRRFIVSFNAVTMFNYNEPLSSCFGDTFKGQVILYEGINAIDILIEHKVFCSDWNNGLAALGIINQDGTEKITPSGRDLSQWATNNEAWRFCPDSLHCNVTTGLPINESKVFSLTLFPNPTTNQLNISIDESLIGAQLNIYNVTGSLVQSAQLQIANSKFEIQNLPNGVYVAVVTTPKSPKGDFNTVMRRWVKM